MSVETCTKCGKTWGVTIEPRDPIVCTECQRVPKPPEGEVRRNLDGVVAVCLGGGRYLRWKVIGEDPEHWLHGWRADSDVLNWAVLGNVHDLAPAPSDGGEDRG